MKTPTDVLPNSIRYFRIYFLGSVAFVLYNNFVGILQSVGDSKHPLYYLIFSSLVNICLDLLFVGVLHMGVGSAAAATIISQFVSAFLCLNRLTRKSPEEYRVSLRKIQLNRLCSAKSFPRTAGRHSEFHYFSGKCGLSSLISTALANWQ